MLVACRVSELRHGFSSAASGRGFVVVDQSAEDRSTSDPAVDRLAVKRCPVPAARTTTNISSQLCGRRRDTPSAAAAVAEPPVFQEGSRPHP
jgi:hypothetical protein